MNRLEALTKSIEEKEKLAVMFSGGLDSALLCLIARKALNKNAAAVNIDSPVTPAHERKRTAVLAREIGIRLITVRLDELSDPGFSANPSDRCYICRKVRQKAVRKALSGSDFKTIADGVNTDDLRDYRPGIKAADEDGIWHPFAEHGFSKSDLRRTARKLGLSVWDAEPSPCLCTRFAYGMQLTHNDIKKVDRIEEYLGSILKGPMRLRCFPNGICMVETDDFSAALNNRKPIADMMFESGFVFAGLDIEGFASGKMNRLLADPGKKSCKGVKDMAKCAKTAAKPAKPAAKKSGCAKSAKPCATKKKA